MKKTLLLCAVLILGMGIGCKKGEKGDTGMPGPVGPGEMKVYSGAVTSDFFTVHVPRLTNDDGLSVYVSDGTDWSELPYLLPAYGVNAYFLARNNYVEIHNGQLAGASQYQIIIIGRHAGAVSLGKILN